MVHQAIAIFLVTLVVRCFASGQNQIIFTDFDVEISITPSPHTDQQFLQTQSNTTFTFDEIHLSQPISNISHYANFNISGFQIFDPFQSVKEGLFPIQDSDCSTSRPNALLGSRNSTGPWPRLLLNPSTDSTNSSYFRLHSFAIKAMGYVPRLLTLKINGFEITDGVIVRMYGSSATYMREGYQGVFVFEFVKYGWWPERINALEFWAEDREGKKDWRFCVDDLKVGFVDD